MVNMLNYGSGLEWTAASQSWIIILDFGRRLDSALKLHIPLTLLTEGEEGEEGEGGFATAISVKFSVFRGKPFQTDPQDAVTL